jgi:hypothetical protein
MKHTEYYRSGHHTNNALTARKKALDSIQLRKLQRMDEYNKDPNRCIVCQHSIQYDRKKNKFCSKSCAAIYNNGKRPAGSESRIAQAHKIKGVKRNGPAKKGESTATVCKIAWHTCRVCLTLFYTRTWSNTRITCGSSECITHLKVGYRPYTNGRRKLFRRWNKWSNTEVLLESSWEDSLANWLDANDIEWHRPKPVKWYDGTTNKDRLYYPDFYLPSVDMYLDPKNPTAMTKDAHKMSIVSGLIPIFYGDIEMIKRQVDILFKTV